MNDLETHTLTSMCWKKCIAKSPSSSASSGSTTSSFFGLGGSKSSISPELDSTERQCLANCVERFLDANFATLQHLRTLQKQMGGGGH
jgi:import inner membrane translocase subunit TIM8